MIKRHHEKQQIYLNTPIELYRTFLDDTIKSLILVFEYAACEFDNKEDAEEYFQLKINNWQYVKKEGTTLRSCGYSGCLFSLPLELFNDFYKNADKKTDDEKLTLLCYMTIKTLVHPNRSKLTNNKILTARMLGFVSPNVANIRLKELQSISFDEYVKVKYSKYFTPYYLEKIRKKVMEKFKTVAIYSEKGKRGFLITLNYGMSQAAAMKILRNRWHNSSQSTDLDF